MRSRWCPRESSCAEDDKGLGTGDRGQGQPTGERRRGTEKGNGEREPAMETAKTNGEGERRNEGVLGGMEWRTPFRFLLRSPQPFPGQLPTSPVPHSLSL